MLSRAFSTIPTTAAVRTFATANVAVLGAAGGIGQPLSLLLKLSGKVENLHLYDLVNTPGVAADVGHCSTRGNVRGFKGADQLGDALKGMDIVVIPAGVPRKPGMTRDDLFNTNASIVATLAGACAQHCPEALFCIISNPVNSTVPIFADVMAKAGKYNKSRVFGVTTLDVVRAEKFVGDFLGKNPAETPVPVIGGHAGITILPLLSHIKGAKFTDENIAALTNRIQFGGDEVVKAKDGTGSATLSMAYAAARFTESLMRARAGEAVTECTFVESNAVPGVRFFATPVTIGKKGIEKIHPVPSMSAFEKTNFDNMLGELKSSIKKGEDFVKNMK